jgi:ADP-ribose pyrophosphatase YjhB (NUDIX family)
MKINNSKEDAIRSGKWSKPNASFYDALISEDNYKDLIKEAFLRSGNINKDTPYSSSKCKYPHHVIKDEELILSEPGVRAAYARAKQMGVYHGKLKDHLDKHLNELDVFKEEKLIEDNFETIMESINKSLGTNLHENIDGDRVFKVGNLDANGNEILDIDFIRSTDGVDNCCIRIENTCMIDNKPQYMRGRSTMICLDVRPEGLYVMSKDIDSDDYAMPGGGWNKNETPKDAAIREFHEESISNVKNVQYMGLLIECDGSKENVKEWVKTHVENPDDWWYGYYSMIFVGIYDGGYTGNVEEIDREDGYKWIKVDIIKPNLPYEYIKAIDDYDDRYLHNKEEAIDSLRNWTESFVYDDLFRENVFVESNVKSPYDLLDYMKQFKYGWFTRGGVVHNGSEGIPGDFYHNFHLQSPHQLAHNKVGVCWDYVEFERQWFTENEYKFAIFYIVLNNGSTQPTHTFLVYNIGSHNYWFECAWEKYHGIHRYGSVDIMLKDIIMRHRQEHNDYKSSVSIHWLQDTPKYGITCMQYMKYASKEPKLDYEYLPSRLFHESSDYYAFMEDENNVDNKEESLLDVELDKDDTAPEMPALDEEDTKEDEGSIDPLDEPIIDSEKEQVQELTDDEKEELKQESLPKQIDKSENDKNGVRRKQLYIAFIEWCKSYNNKNTFGSIFDKDAFKITYPFVPHELRYFYRLSNPMLCVLEGDLTFFPVADLRRVNSKNKKMNELLIFAATPNNNLRVFDCNDKKVYKAHDENNQLVKDKVLGETFDLYIQNMINKGDILNAELSEEKA